MTQNAVLPVVGLILTIYLVTKLRGALAKQALFSPPLSRVDTGERIAHGIQLALGILLAIVVLTGLRSTQTATDSNTLPSVAPAEHIVNDTEHFLKLKDIYRLLVR